MATEAERRILHITDNLELLNDTQIAFEDVRDDVAGLSYIGGAFGGRYDANSSSWGTAIARFARYNSSPVFENIIFNKPTTGTDSNGDITLTIAGELTETSGLPSDIYPRSPGSINIGYSAGANQISTTNTTNVNIGFYAGIGSQTNNSTFIGAKAGFGVVGEAMISILAGSTSDSSGGINVVNIGTELRSVGAHIINIGDNTYISGDSVIRLGGGATGAVYGEDSVLIGRTVGIPVSSSNNIAQSVYMGSQAGYQVTGAFDNVGIGTDVSHTSYAIKSVEIGADAGANNNNNVPIGVGSVSLGWGAGNNVIPVDNTSLPDIVIGSVYNGPHQGFNVNLGSFAGDSSQGSDNINIGYGAGGYNQNTGGSSWQVGTNIESIAIGTFAGQETNGTKNMYFGSNSGHKHVGDGCVFIGEDAGSNLTVSSAFQLSQGTDILFDGSFTGEWVRAYNMFGMKPYTTTEVNAFTAVQGFMSYDSTLNEPVYYNGTAWVVFGSAGVTEYKNLTDVTSTYLSGDYGIKNSIMKTNAGANGVTYTDFVELDDTTNNMIIKAGILRLNQLDNSILTGINCNIEVRGTAETDPNHVYIHAEGSTAVSMHLESDEDHYCDTWNDEGDWYWRYRSGSGPIVDTNIMKLEMHPSPAKFLLSLPETTPAMIDTAADGTIVPTVEWVQANYVAGPTLTGASVGTIPVYLSDGTIGFNGYEIGSFNDGGDTRISPVDAGNNFIVGHSGVGDYTRLTGLQIYIGDNEYGNDALIIVKPVQFSGDEATVTADGLDNDGIIQGGAKSLITKEYGDAYYGKVQLATILPTAGVPFFINYDNGDFVQISCPNAGVYTLNGPITSMENGDALILVITKTSSNTFVFKTTTIMDTTFDGTYSVTFTQIAANSYVVSEPSPVIGVL